jgi:hypothetical protein
MVKIGQLVKKWHQVFEVQDGGGRHLELCKDLISCVKDVFYVDVVTSPPCLVKVSQIVKK